MRKLRRGGKRFLCLAMSAVLLLGSVTGCGKKANKNNVTDSETVTEATENITDRESEAESTTGKPSEPAAEKPTQKDTEPVTQKPTQKDTEPATEKPTQKDTEPATEKPTEKDTEPATEKPTEKDTEPATEKPTEKETEPVTEKPTEKDTEPATEKPTDTEQDEYTITIGNAAADAKIKQITKKKGVKLSSINGPYIDGKLFLGWYYDSKLTDKAAADDVLDRNMTLYADYGDAMPISEGGSPNYISAVEQDKDFTIYVTTDTAKRAAADVDEVKAALKLTNITSPERTDDSNTLEKDELVVVKTAAGRYSVKVNGGFRAGDTYRLEIIDNDIALSFEGQTKDVVYYNFTIKKDEILNLSLNTGIKYLAASELEKQYADNIMAYTGLYTAEKDAQTGETVYKPTNATGAFTYKAGEYIAGDVIAVYTGTKPDERTLDTSLDEAVSYIEITMVESDGDTAVYSYKSANATDVLFTPDIIPIDIDNGDGVTGWTEAATQAAIGYFEIENSKLNFTDSKYAAMGLDFSTTVEAGDFVAFFSGDFGAEDAQQKGYGKITEVIEEKTKTKISYELVSYDDVLAAMDIYNESQLTQAQLNSIDEQLIVSTIENQVIESGFAQEAGMYLATLAVETDEVKDLLGESELTIKDCMVTYADGTPVSDGEIMLTAENTAKTNQPTVTVNVSRDLEHFEEGSGFRVEVALKYAFDVQKTGSKNKVAIEMTAVFETEVLLGFSANGGAVWKMKWIFPYIYDYKMSGSIDQGLYTGIAITATAQLDEDEPENTFGPELLEPDGLEDYAQQLIDLSESIKNMMEENKQAGEEGEEGDDDDGESAGTASGGLLEKYERFISAANDKWIDLIEAPIFAAEGSLDPFYVTAYSIDVKFVVSANMSVAIGMSFQYEKSQRHTFTMMLFHRNQSSSETVDLSTEYFQFDFYVMGTLGIRAGVRAKVLFGLFSTKLAGIGLQLEAGAYARLWGYFYYCMSWEKGKDIESSATGAVLMEIGAYLEVNLAMEVMNGTFSFNPSIYSNEWPIWHVGERENVLDFAYDEEGKWTEEDDGEEIEYSIPLSFDMVRIRTMEVPSEIFRMRYMDLKEGGEGCLTYDGNKRAGLNAATSEYDDEERFFVEMSDPHFKYNPVDNTITVVPEEGVGSYEGTMTITWKQPDLTYASKTISQTFNITWVDPDAGYCLAFDTKGGTVIKTKVYGIGKEVEKVENPTKIGYAFGGWYSDKACTRAEAVPSTMPAHDVTLYAKWIPIPNVYTVRHYYESLGTQYELTETTKQYNVYDVDEVSGKKPRRDYIYTDDVLKAEDLVRDNKIVPEGFEIDWSLTTSSMSVAPDGSTVVDIYYKRQIHSVTYSMGELKDSDNPDVVIRYRYGETIYVPTYFMLGYTFENWEKEYGNPAESDVSENNKSIIMGVEDIKYVAKWKANDDTPYYIEYYILDESSGKYIMLGGDNGKLYKEGTTGTKVSVSANVLKDIGYTLNYATVNGRGADLASTGEIDAYGKLTIAYYYEGEDYYITYDLDGGEFLGDDVNKYPYMYTHGFALELKDVTPVKEGYSFVGWLEGDEPVTSIPSYRVGDINLTAEWRADRGDIALYDSDGTTLGNIRATYGETVPSLGSIPVKAGYDFAGFYTEEGEEYYDAAGNGKVIWLGAKDIRLKASWTAKRLTISFDVNGGDTEPASIEGTYLDNYPALPTPTRQGYSFVGWTVENDASGNYVTADTVISNSDAHTLVAQWKNGTNTQYTVERYVEKAADGNIDGTDTETKEYVLYDKSIGYGTTNKDVVINASLYGIAGYAFDGNNSQNVLTGMIKADGSTVFALYYNIKPANYFTVTYDYGRDDMPYKTQYVKDGETYGLPDVGKTTDDHMKLVGWRDDIGVFNKDNTATVNHSDAHYTAVWEKDEYTLYYRLLKDGFDEDFVKETYSYNETDKLMGELFLLEPVKDENGNIIKYYKFTGWNTKRDGSGKMYMPGTSLSDVELVADESDYGRKSLYGQWELVDVPEGMTPYIVVHKVEFSGGNGYFRYYTLKFGKYEESTDAVSYEFRDVKAQDINQKKIGVDIVTQPAPDEAYDSFNNVYYAYEGYTVVEVVYDRIWHTFTVKLDNGENDIVINQLAGWYLNRDNIPSAPSKTGYEFAGWDYEIPECMPEYDVTLTAKYRETDRRAVTVKYYMQNLDGTYNETPESTAVIYGKTGTAITSAPEVFAGFKTPEAKSVTVLDDGSAVCEYRYERAEYTITWDAGEGELTGTDYSTGKVKYGQTITAPGLNRPGYTGAWKNLTDTMPANDVTFTADYEAQDVFYSVVYRRMDVNGAYTLMYSQNKTAKAGSIVQESCEVSDKYASQVAEGYIKPLVQTVEIAGDGSTVIYYDYRLIKSHLGYDLSGGTAATSNYAQSGDYYYGKTLQIPVLSQVKRTGYAAKGWYDASDPSKKLVDGNNITIGAKDVTYKLLWEPVTYTITYDLVLDGAQSLNNPSQYRTGLDFNISAPKCDDMSFVRWEWAGDGAMPAEVKILDNGLVHVTESAQGNLRFRAVWSEDKLVFSATLYDGSPETYIYYYPAAGSEDITLAQIAVPVREGYVFSYWTKKIPKSTYGYYDVVLRDDTKVSTLNFNIDFVTANWMPLVTTDGFDGYQICVSSEKELELAIEYIKSDSRYTGIALSNDITINELSEPLFEIFDDGYVLLGNNHKLTLKRAAAPLFGENYGEIRELGIVGNVNNSVDSAKTEETGFGVIAGVNKGIIKGCFIEGVSTDDGVTRNTITSNATHFGGLVGINEGIITECRISDTNVIWDDTAAALAANYIGGFAGMNNNDGAITNCSMTSATVSVKSGYDINTSHRLYIGGYAGMNQGMISDSTVAGSRIGNQYLVSSANVAYMSAGGFAGIDAVSGSDADVRGISGVTISDTEIRSESVAGGIIGENNYALIEKASLTNVYVYGGREYAGQLAGINRSTAAAEGYCYYINARTETKTGKAGVIAGLCEKPADYEGMTSIIAVRTNDNKTTVINGDKFTNYGKGAFFYEFRNDKVWIQFYDIKNLAEKW